MNNPCLNAHIARMQRTTHEILEEVESTLNHRSTIHGGRESSFNAIADVWNWYIERTQKLTGYDVAQMMVLMKMARQLCGSKAHRDHGIDEIGYAAIAAELNQ